MSSKIKVIIVDDHRIFIDGIKSLFVGDTDIEIVGFAENKSQLMELLDNSSFDVLLLDLNLGGSDGVDLLSSIKQQNIECKIIALTMYNLPNLVKKVMENGGNGYILKNTSKTSLKEAIIKVYSGDNYLDISLNNSKNKEDKKCIIENYPDDFLRLHNLSKREFEIIILLAESYSTKEIAEVLFISEQTVSTYRKNIKAKLNFKSTADIVRFVFDNNLN